MDKICVVLNPGAGTAMELQELERVFARQLPNADVRPTARSGGAERVARQAAADGYDCIVAAGGDGTLNEVVNGVAQRLDDVALGLIPLGTGNDFARSADIPQELDRAIETLRAGKTRQIDLVRATTTGERFFLNISAGGFSGVVDEHLTAEIKGSWGPLAYLRCAATALPNLHPYHATIALDDIECLSLNIFNIVVANGRYVAGGMPIAPEASIDDGLLEVVILCETSAARLALVAPRILRGVHVDDEEIVIYRRAAKVSVNPRGGMPINLDGELLGEEPVTFQVLPRALQFVVP